MEKESAKKQETGLKVNKNAGKGGVYQIKNKLNGKIYIGSSNNMEIRWIKHKRLLMIGRHENKHLRNYMNKVKKEKNISENTLNEIFHFGCIEYEDDLVKRFALEQEYLTLLFDGGKMCYNHQKIANPQYNYTPSDPESTKKKKSIALKTRCNDEEYRKRLSIRAETMWSNPEYRTKKTNILKKMWADPIFKAKKTAIRNSPEYKKNMSIAIKKTWENEEYRKKVIASMNSPESKKKKCKNAKIARNHPETKRKLTESQIKNGQVKPFFLINNIGILFYVESITQWSRKHKLNALGIAQLKDGKRAQYKGYKLYMSPEAVSKENQKFFNTSKSADLHVIKPDKYLFILSDRAYRENMIKKIKILRRR